MNSKVTKEKALRYHEYPVPGKIEVLPSKNYDSQLDISLAYSPGVAYPCLAIKDNPYDVFRYTGKGNLVAVISNGTAVLGLGNIGPLAGKPVMEGKALLFKVFAGINGFDLELLDAVAARCAVPIIASGGAGCKEDFLTLFRDHPAVDAGLAASIFHTKQVEIRDLKHYLRENGIEMRL